MRAPGSPWPPAELTLHARQAARPPAAPRAAVAGRCLATLFARLGGVGRRLAERLPRLALLLLLLRPPLLLRLPLAPLLLRRPHSGHHARSAGGERVGEATRHTAAAPAPRATTASAVPSVDTRR